MMTKMKKLWPRLLAVMLLFVSIAASQVSADTAKSENEIHYNAKNEVTNGSYAEPTRDGYVFLGWATSQEHADAGIVDLADDKPNDVTNTYLNSIGGVRR